VAVSCSDAGNPVAPGGPEQPEPAFVPENVLAVMTCTVDVRAGTETCGPPQPDAGDALFGLVAIGTVGQVTFNTTNTALTSTSLSYDRSLTNNIYQALGTLDGVNPDPTGIRVWLEPFVIDTAVAGQTTTVAVVNADGNTFVYNKKTYNRPYFQYPGLLEPGATSIEKNWQFSMQNVDSFTFKVYFLSELQFPLGTLWITPDSPVVQVDSSKTLAAHIRDATKLSIDPVTWSSSDPAVVTVTKSPAADSLAVITGVSEGGAWIKAQSNHPRADYAAPRLDSVWVTVNNAPSVPLDSINALQNVSGTVSPARLRQGLDDGDSIVPSQTFDSQHGNAVINAAGELTYVADPGYAGQDTVLYDVTDGEWTVKRTLLVNVAPTHYWFVREGASGGGSNKLPLGSINAASDSATAGDTIFVLRNGSNELVGAHTLDAGEALIGAGVPAAFLLEATDLNEANHKDLIFQGQGVGTTLMNTGAPTLTLGSNNLVRGVNISSADAAAIHGVGFGTLTVGDVIVQAGGPALSLSGGDLAGSFLALHSTNSDSSGISLTNVGGTLTATGSSITGAATAAFSVSGGSVAINFPGDVTHAGTGRLLQVSSHSGNASFAGALSATAGSGVLFSAAEGSYAFTGAMSLNGGDAGLDVTSSGGSFTFANASVTNPTGGPAVHVVGGSPAILYTGSITHNTGRVVLVDGVTADSVVLDAAITSGTSGAPTGLGILVQNVAGGVVSLDGTKSLFTGASPAVTVNNPAGVVRFRDSLDITTTTGAGFTASGAGTVTATGINKVATGTGIPVSLTSVNTGTAGVSFASVSTSTGAPNGIVLNGISGAGFQATGGAISGTPGAAVLLTNTNAADSISLRGMTLTRSAGTGAVISGTNFGKLHALNTSVQASGGPGALALATGTMSGTYSVVSSNASTGSGVSLTGVNGTFNASGGSINTAGAAAFLVSGGSVSGTISSTVAQASAVPLLSVTGGHETGAEVLTFAGNVTATNGNGLQFDNADGTYTFTANVSLQGGDAGIDITNGSGGDFTFPATSNIVSPSTGNLVSILNSAPNFTYPGQFTKANNNVTGILVSNNTGGTIAFNGTGTKSISSGTAAAVNLANNSGAAINFSGGGLSITSGTGAGFSATGGGTVQVTNDVNTITSAGGVALNVQNTTIGASGLRFQSINANGGANGIVLSSTGALNGLQVTGTGATAGSGGTIQNTTVSGASFTDARNINLGLMNFTNANSVDGGGAGSCDLGTNAGCNAAIKLSNVTTVNLDRLNVNGTAEHGVNGRTVTDFSLTNSSILNSGDSGSEFAVSLFELFGTAGGGTENLISGNTLSDAGEHVIFVRTSTATNSSPSSPDRLVISSNTIADPGTRNAASGSQGDGITVSLRGTANFQTVVQNNTFNTSETGTDGVQVDAGDTSRSDATITGNHFNGSYSVGGTNIAAYNTAVNVSGSGSSNTTFSVTNNPTVIVGVGNAINVASNGDANLRGTVSGHTINTPAGLRDGVSNGSNLENAGFGIDMVVDQTGSIVANVTNNTVAGGHMTAFRSTARNGNGGSVDANVSNNVFNSGGLFAQWPVMLMAGNDAAGESVRLCFNLSNNQTSTTAGFTEHYWMEVWDAPTAGFNNVIQFQGLVPASGATEAQVETHVDASDPSPPPAGVGKVEAFGAEVINYTAATCATP
jgi:hypothetical protein